MYSLILKDLLLVKKMLPFTALYGFFIIILFQDGMDMGSGGFVSGIVGVAYLLSIKVMAYEEINKADIMLLSLPIRRNKIVLAKYISIFVYGLFGIIAYLIGVIIFKMFNLSINIYSLSFDIIIGAVFGLSIMFSIIYPVFFRFGYIKSKFIVMIIFIGVFFGVPYLLSLLNINRFNSINTIATYLSTLSEQEISLLLLLLSFLIILISYSISVKVYKNKEF